MQTDAAKNRILLLAWPDCGAEDTFGLRCVEMYSGRVVVHVGELFGGTHSVDNPWGQTTSESCQIALASRFRRVATTPLPRWPGHLDEMTVWRQIVAAVTVQHSNHDDTISLCHLATPKPE